MSSLEQSTQPIAPFVTADENSPTFTLIAAEVGEEELGLHNGGARHHSFRHVFRGSAASDHSLCVDRDSCRSRILPGQGHLMSDELERSIHPSDIGVLRLRGVAMQTRLLRGF